MTPSAKREVATKLVTEHSLSVQRACCIARLSRAAYYDPPDSTLERDAPVMDAFNGLLERFPRIGFWKCVDRIRKKVFPWNPKRLHRVYVAMGLNLPRRTKRRLPARLRQVLAAPATLNLTWALDFMSDALYGGRKFRTLNVLDEGNREVLAIDVAFSIPSVRVIRLMEELIEVYGKPSFLRVDNGPELTSEAFVEWCRAQGIELRYIQPGKPAQNAYIERFNRTYREGVLDAYLFESISEVQTITDEWLEDYNSERSHDSLGGVPPVQFLPRLQPPREYGFGLSI